MIRCPSVSSAASVTNAVALALPHGNHTALLDVHSHQWEHMNEELQRVANEATRARRLGMRLDDAAHDPEFPAFAQFHQDLRDAMFVEIPKDLQPWVSELQQEQGEAAAAQLGNTLTHWARQPSESDSERPEIEAQSALSEVLLFEAVRLRLLVAVWKTDDFERLGGEEADVDHVAWDEVESLLHHPDVERTDVRPLHLMFAAASMSLTRHATELAAVLQRSGPELRERLDMQARLRAALRELRLTESVLLENALASTLDHDRIELPELQEARPMALEGMSRQAMDQRVSRGRRALTRSRQSWPCRRRPALIDLLDTP